MLHPTLTLTRFHGVMLGALSLAIPALALRRMEWFIAVVAALLIVIGLGVALPRLRLFGPFVCRGATRRRCVALTFDDGPDPASTPALLDLLREAQVQATFFCVGERVTANPGLSARIAREGHLLANHSYAHSNWTNFFGFTRLRLDLERTQLAIRDATGVAPKLFRPPMGLSNPRVFGAARALGLQVIGWTARGWDTVSAEPERIVSRIMRRLQPGAIVLLHDGGIPAGRLLLTVKRLLDRLREHDYEILRLDRILE